MTHSRSAAAACMALMASAFPPPAATARGIATAPATLLPAPATANLRLWLHDPRGSATTPLATGIFLQGPGDAAWQFVPAQPDGSLNLQLAPGSYQFDTVEPNGAARALLRHRYRVTVAAGGAAGIAGSVPDSRGIHVVSLDLAVAPANAAVRAAQDRLTALAKLPASAFTPASPCQLMDQLTPERDFATDVSAGFPKVRVRLPSSGTIRALIVPVDFPDLRGRDDPTQFFAPLAADMRGFYLKQSYGRVRFDFQILPAWIHLPFSPERFGIGIVNGAGDVNAYRNDIVAFTDGQIDYSAYDAVYFLVPKETPMATMGFGPAITFPTWTRTGYLVNGAMGGADMYVNETRGVDGAQWKWMAHETGHAFGLLDEDLHHASSTLGSWGIMANSWSKHAIEHNGWDRYLQGWLDQPQVSCLTRPNLPDAGATVRLSPLVRQAGGTKLALVPLSSATILAIESRKNEGYDHISPGREGVLVYTVDMRLGSLGGGYRTQRRPGSTDPNFEDAALHVGDTVAVDRVTVTVTASDADGDTVTVRRQVQVPR